MRSLPPVSASITSCPGRGPGKACRTRSWRVTSGSGQAPGFASDNDQSAGEPVRSVRKYSRSPAASTVGPYAALTLRNCSNWKGIPVDLVSQQEDYESGAAAQTGSRALNVQVAIPKVG